MTFPKKGGGVEVVKTCPAAMGFAFAAGTTDGPGAFDFKQGDDKVICNSNSLWAGHCENAHVPFRGCMFCIFTVYSYDMSGKSFLEVGAKLT